MTEKEAAALDKQINLLTPKVQKKKKEYDSLVEQLAKLIEQRHPERQEDVVKERLWKAYLRSGKDTDFIINFIENAPDDDDYWN